MTGSRVVVAWNGTAANTGKASYLDFAGTYTKSDGTTGSVSHAYRHGLLDVQVSELAGDGRADLNAVIQQRLADEYVRGIGEVPSSWPAEALKAQAVAARSYALATVISSNASASAANLARFTAAGIDVDAAAGELQRKGADAFVASWRSLLERIEQKAAAVVG